MLEPLMYMSTKKSSKYYLNVNARSESGSIRSHSQNTNNLTRASSASSEDSGECIVEVLCTEKIIQKR
jgi:hypothetical protein